jgi:1-acyl-sn-glycerol-3-phosphate acyltransferase
MRLLRGLLFNIFFYGVTALFCILFIPTLFFSRNVILWVTRFWLNTVAWIEKYILGLSYEVRGQEHIPTDTNYILAAKHQSAYETMKLHHLLGDPTVVLKKELLRIPIFGLFLKKVGVIAIDRNSKEAAMSSLIEGAKRMKDQNRPVVIFPQGTRVAPHETTKDKPYKGGIIKMYKHSDMPVVPLALNSGLFWGRNHFLKKPGKVIFEFLPPIESGLSDKNVIAAIEERLEEKTLQLMQEAKDELHYLEFTPKEALETR